MFLLKTKKYQKFPIASANSGFTLIEALTVLFIFSMITMTFYSVFTLGTSYIIESKNRLGAVSLANEKMEIIRNLQYDSIGIVGGVPSGNIPAEEDVVENKHAYHVKTFVQYIDDTFDGVYPADVIPNDYKRVKVTISWGGANNTQSSIFLVARFVPPGMEQSVSGGILSINVIGGDGIGIPQASVHITNSDVSPAVNINVMTDNSGNIILPGAKSSIEGYYLTVSKNGYETVQTIDPDTVTYAAIDIPASVVEGMLNVKSVVQNKLVNLKIITVDCLGVPLADINFDLTGGRILGNDLLTSPATPIYNIDASYATDANGEKILDGASPGQFFISNVIAPSGYTFVGVNEFSAFDVLNNQYAVLTTAGEDKEIKMKFANNNVNGIIVKVIDVGDNDRITAAQVTLSNSDGYSEQAVTLLDGVVYFPLSATPILAGTYDIKVIADGYNTHTQTVDINGLLEYQANLTAS